LLVSNFIRIIETLLISLIGGIIFSILNIPLPFILGAICFTVIWKVFSKRDIYVSNVMKDIGFIILGLNFGLYFTLETFKVASLYMIPYIIFTFILIGFCIVLGYMITKWVKIDKVSSIFSCIPGGLSEMVIASESLGGKSSYVAIFQTIRLITVLSTVPLLMTHFFSINNQVNPEVGETLQANIPLVHYVWFIIPIIISLLIKNKLPAGIIIGSLVGTAILNIGFVQLPPVPERFMYFGQLLVGASIGKNISVEDLKRGGTYSVIYFGISLLIIVFSIILGMLLGFFTPLNYATSILSIAPGGLFEMVLTAYAIGGDPAIVSALQLIRILMIVLIVPSFLKWLFTRKFKKQIQSQELP